MPIVSIDATIVAALEQSGCLASLKNGHHHRSLTDMLQRNGVLQTIAFLRSKPREQSEPLLTALQIGLESIPGQARVSLDMRDLARLDAGRLLALSQRLTRVAVWIARLVETMSASTATTTSAKEITS